MGRDSRYTPEIVEAYCAILSRGGNESEAKKRVHLSDQTVSVWKKKHPEFVAAVEKAKQDQWRYLPEKLQQLAGDQLRLWLEGKAKETTIEERIRKDKAGNVIGSDITQRHTIRPCPPSLIEKYAPPALPRPKEMDEITAIATLAASDMGDPEHAEILRDAIEDARNKIKESYKLKRQAVNEKLERSLGDGQTIDVEAKDAVIDSTKDA